MTDDEMMALARCCWDWTPASEQAQYGSFEAYYWAMRADWAV